MFACRFGSQLQCWQEGGRKACKKIKVFKQMKGDMHILHLAIGELNADWSGYRFGVLEGERRGWEQCKFEIDFNA